MQGKGRERCLSRQKRRQKPPDLDVPTPEHLYILVIKLPQRCMNNADATLGQYHEILPQLIGKVCEPRIVLEVGL
jgi:hypothetical protein